MSSEGTDETLEPSRVVAAPSGPSTLDLGPRPPRPLHPEEFPVAQWERYESLGYLGGGGMGAVFRARDRRLGREVALKFIRGVDADHLMRFVQEARAQARIDHPNVCKVYEVGEVEGRAYIAMQLVAGERLDRAAPGLSLPQRVQVIRDVALAMHEAHKLGIIHRDLKPANIMVERGEDGRPFPVVMDFGLAHETGGDLSLTRTGTIVGTPAYMSPEQARGQTRDIDRRTDVYSLGATLYELLAGHPPFAAPAVADVMSKLLLEDPPSLRRQVPRDLETITMRCLQKEMGRRYDSARALADDLQRYIDGVPIPGARTAALRRLARFVRRRRGVVAAALALPLVVWLTAVVVTRRTRCTGGEASLRTVWNEQRKAAVRQSFLAGGRPFAADTYARIERILDGYGASWTGMHRAACEATAVRHEQSPAALDLRMTCLGRQLGALRELVDALARTGAVEQAIGAARAIEPVEACADVAALGAAFPAPPPAIVERATALRAEVDRAQVLTRLGRYDEALALAREALAGARPLGYPPLLAAALNALGGVQIYVSSEQPLAEATLREALQAAAAARDDELAARDWGLLLGVLVQQRREKEALDQQTGAEAAVVRAGDPPLARGIVETQVGTALRRLGRLDEARLHLERGVQLIERGADPTRLQSVLQALGNVRRDQGALDEARALHRRALALAEETLGPEHPSVAIALYNLAQLTPPEEGLAVLERARRIIEPVYGADSAEAARVASSRAELLLTTGRCVEGLELARASLATKSRRLPAGHPDVANGMTLVGALQVCVGEVAEGRRTLEQAVAALDKRPGPLLDSALDALAQAALMQADHATAEALARRVLAGSPDDASALWCLGSALRQRDPAAALPELRKALETMERRYGPEANLVATVLVETAAALRDLGRAAEARPLGERALAIREAHGPTPRHRGNTRFDLALTLEALGDREGARRAATVARDELAAAGPSGADRVKVVDAWLARRAP